MYAASTLFSWLPRLLPGAVSLCCHHRLPMASLPRSSTAAVTLPHSRADVQSSYLELWEPQAQSPAPLSALSSRTLEFIFQFFYLSTLIWHCFANFFFSFTDTPGHDSPDKAAPHLSDFPPKCTWSPLLSNKPFPDAAFFPKKQVPHPLGSVAMGGMREGWHFGTLVSLFLHLVSVGP